MERLVSIVIPLYNYKDYIEECIESCINQTYKNIEIIIVDDCSNDGSYLIAKDYEDDVFLYSPRLVNMGCSFCRNYGISKARGEFIAHLDADDVLTKDSIEIRMRYFNKNTNLDMVHGLAWRWRKKKDKWHIDGYNEKSKIHTQAVMIRRSVYEKYGLFYEPLRSKEDKEMWYRLGVHPISPLPKLIKAKKIKSFVACYRKHEKQKHRLRKEDKTISNNTEKIFWNRIKQLQEEGITMENTKFL